MSKKSGVFDLMAVLMVSTKNRTSGETKQGNPLMKGEVLLTNPQKQKIRKLMTDKKLQRSFIKEKSGILNIFLNSLSQNLKSGAIKDVNWVYELNKGYENIPIFEQIENIHSVNQFVGWIRRFVLFDTTKVGDI